MAEEEMAQPVEDPLETLANILEAAAERVPYRPKGAKTEANAALLGSVLLARRVVYNTCYYLSYGVVYSSLTLASAVPMDNVMGAGLRDGTEAAHNAMQKRIAAQGAWGSAALKNEDVDALVDSLDLDDDDTIKE